ncbi:MAG: hypothetical protein SAJ37_15805 [Oscillatoria sp. PMC 1068.18]|nr:hypothetical protein [Oscillatoria sp. PMC 1076.18]MEC4990197.1 hypothetical protein [Oscillatoria sp. PMC 1068.18]
MSSLEKRLSAFRQLPLKAQLTMINATKANAVLAQNQEYLASLEQIHEECLQKATLEAQKAYEKAKIHLSS